MVDMVFKVLEGYGFVPGCRHGFFISSVGVWLSTWVCRHMMLTMSLGDKEMYIGFCM